MARQVLYGVVCSGVKSAEEVNSALLDIVYQFLRQRDTMYLSHMSTLTTAASKEDVSWTLALGTLANFFAILTLPTLEDADFYMANITAFLGSGSRRFLDLDFLATVLQLDGSASDTPVSLFQFRDGCPLPDMGVASGVNAMTELRSFRTGLIGAVLSLPPTAAAVRLGLSSYDMVVCACAWSIAEASFGANALARHVGQLRSQLTSKPSGGVTPHLCPST